MTKTDKIISKKVLQDKEKKILIKNILFLTEEKLFNPVEIGKFLSINSQTISALIRIKEKFSISYEKANLLNERCKELFTKI